MIKTSKMVQTDGNFPWFQAAGEKQVKRRKFTSPRVGVTGQTPQCGNTATRDDIPVAILHPSQCWFEGGEEPRAAGSSSQLRLSSRGELARGDEGAVPGGAESGQGHS